MTANSYLKRFAAENEAADWMAMKNQTARDGSIFVLTDGPEDDFAVVDIRTAIDMDAPYRWSTR
jgi:hypothetical protein